MTTTTRRRSRRVARQASELALAVPQVVAHRVSRMVGAGATPSARDRREFQRMGAEKVAAFTESWNATVLQMFRANQALALSFMQSWNPLLRGKPSGTRLARAFHSAALGVMAKGIAPVHRRAVANAKRLARSKR